jgi:hypothetical protein
MLRRWLIVADLDDPIPGFDNLAPDFGRHRYWVRGSAGRRR